MATATPRSAKACVWTYKKTYMLVLAPLLISLIPLTLSTAENYKAMNCAFVILVMAFYWMTEVLPIAVTALLPIVLLPPLKVMSSKIICTNYLKDTNMLLFAGMAVAIAVEKCNLHRRLALRVLLMVGSQPKWLMFGFMSVTAFLSMWISNTAATAMIIPIVHAVLGQLRSNLEAKIESARAAESETEIEVKVDRVVSGSDKPPSVRRKRSSLGRQKSVLDELEKEMTSFKSFNVGLRLCICYAASIGGTATLTGTPANLVLPGFIDDRYGAEAAKGVDFVSWFIFGAPTMLLELFCAWVVMLGFYQGPRAIFTSKKTIDNTVTVMIKKEYKALGSMSFAEKMVSGHFTVLALLWLLRDPKFMSGWGELFGSTSGYITDASVGITVVVSLFIFPAHPPPFLCCVSKPKAPSVEDAVVEPEQMELVEQKPTQSGAEQDDGTDVRQRSTATTAAGVSNGGKPAADTTVEASAAPPPFKSQASLLDWNSIHTQVSWSAMLILGSGFALAKACEVSGLSTLIGGYLSKLDFLPQWTIVLIFCMFVGAMTQITSNTGTIAIFLPIAAETADTLRLNPYYATMGPTYASSLAFMLPVSTPPNALVLGYGHVTIADMAKSGGILALVTLAVLQLSINGYAYPAFGYASYPEWAVRNLTMGAN